MKIVKLNSKYLKHAKEISWLNELVFVKNEYALYEGNIWKKKITWRIEKVSGVVKTLL